MKPDPEHMLAQPGPLFQSLDPAYDIMYPLASPGAFKTVNAAVFYVLSRYSTGVPVERDEVDGGTVYYLLYRMSMIQLFVLHVSDTTACIRFHNCAPLAAYDGNTRDYAWRPSSPDRDYQVGISALLEALHDSVCQLLGYRLALNVDTAPPPPPSTNMYSALLWRRIYHPKMTDVELAAVIGVTPQHVRNKLTKYRQLRREEIQLGHERQRRLSQQGQQGKHGKHGKRSR